MAGRTVVAAVDDSPGSQAAVAWLADNVARGANLTVLMCAPEQQGFYSGTHLPPSSVRCGWDDTMSRVQAAKEVCETPFPQAQVTGPTDVADQDVEVIVARSGSSESIGESILARAQELHASMLAIAPHTRSASERVLKGSVTDYCMRHSRLPVLVVRGVVGTSEAGPQQEAA